MSTEDTLSWETRSDVYRQEAPIQAALESASRIKIDLSLLKELRSFFPRMRDQDDDTRRIRGPADLHAALIALDEVQSIKDRTAEIILVYTDFKSRLERLSSIVETQLFTKKEVLLLKNDGQRKAVVSITAPEIADRLSKASRILAAADLVARNINQTYNIIRTQADIIKEMMYEGGISNIGRKRATLAAGLADTNSTTLDRS